MTSTRLVRRGLVLLGTLLVTLGVLVPGLVRSREDQGVKFHFQATLRGIDEVPATSTGASGNFRGILVKAPHRSPTR